MVDRTHISEFLDELERTAYRRGRRDAAESIIKAANAILMEIPEEQLGLPLPHPETAQSSDGTFAPVRLRAKSDQFRVWLAIREQPGIRGVEVVERLKADGAAVQERTVRTALHRLRIRGLIQLDGSGWHPTQKMPEIVGSEETTEKGQPN